MTRKEEATNKILEFIEIVKDVPKNESILAIGMDMVEWADKTMLESIISYLNNININDYVSSITSGIGIINFNIKKLCDDIRNVMEDEL